MRLHHVALTVKNLSESKNFYSHYFGFKEVLSFERKDLGGKAVWIECDNAILELWEFVNSKEKKEDHPIKNLSEQGMKHIAFEIKNIESFVYSLPKDSFVTEIQIGASGAKYCFVEDPNGIHIEIYEPA